MRRTVYNIFLVLYISSIPNQLFQYLRRLPIPLIMPHLKTKQKRQHSNRIAIILQSFRLKSHSIALEDFFDHVKLVISHKKSEVNPHVQPTALF